MASGDSLALITHSDNVRILLTHLLGLRVARYIRFKIAVASISAVLLCEDPDPRIVFINWTPSFPVM